jgi:hypothetical protein
MGARPRAAKTRDIASSLESPLKVVGLDHIDYWQGIYAIQRGLKNRFGIRVRDGRCWALVQIGDDEARTFGKAHEIPVDFSTLSSVLYMIVGDHQLSYPNSDLIDVSTGAKSIQEAFGSPDKIGVKRVTANGTSAMTM